MCICHVGFIFFFNDTATTEIYTLSLHDALPIYTGDRRSHRRPGGRGGRCLRGRAARGDVARVGRDSRVVRLGRAGLVVRSEEHTSELQSRQYLVCRLLLEKKNKQNYALITTLPL